MLNPNHFYQHFGGWLFQDITPKTTPTRPNMNQDYTKHVTFSKNEQRQITYITVNKPENRNKLKGITKSKQYGDRFFVYRGCLNTNKMCKTAEFVGAPVKT